MKREKIFSIAFGGILTAISLIILFVGNIPFAEYIAPVFAGVLILFAYIEFSAKIALTIYGACSLLALIVSPNKEPALLYIFFFGYYPALRFLLDEKLKIKALSFVIKIFIFNCSMAVAYLILIFVFGMPLDEMGDLGKYSFVILGAALNIAFLAFEFSLKSFALFYTRILQKKIHHIFKLK